MSIKLNNTGTEVLGEKIARAEEFVDDTLDKVTDAAETAFRLTEEKVIDVKKFGSSIPSKLASPVKAAKTALEKKVEQTAKELEDALPTINRAGYELISVDIEIGTMPKLIPRFKIFKTLTPEERHAVEHEEGASRMTRSMVDALLKTQLISNVKVGSLELDIVELHLGAIPKAKVRFSK